MFTGILMFLLVSKITVAQINGEFWWLSDKVAKLKGVEPPSPKFEELSEFDTDESAKIIFRDSPESNTIDEILNNKSKVNYFETGNIIFPDDDSYRKSIISHLIEGNVEQQVTFFGGKTTTKKVTKEINMNNGDVFIFKYPDDDNIIITKYPTKEEPRQEPVKYNNSNMITNPLARDDDIELNKKIENNTNEHDNQADVFTFKFPDDDLLVKTTSQSPNDTITIPNNESTNVQISSGNDIINSLHDDTVYTETKESTFSENICTYMKKNECYQKGGVVYTSYKANIQKLMIPHRICCVIPLSSIDSHRIVFPDSSGSQSKRFRRSNEGDFLRRSQRQRDFLLQQKFKPQNVKPTIQTKIVTPDEDDYVDPYLNIKTSNMKKSNTRGSSKQQDCSDPDYVEDYVVELPKPGLVGLYSDNGQSPPWFMNDNSRPSYGADTSVEESEEDEEPSFGYGTVDPRRGTPKPKRGRPSKLTTSLPDASFQDSEGQTVSFQSTPNFQVLQGFKILNLGRNKNKFYTKGNRRSTTEGSVESDSREQDVNTSQLSLFRGSQVYENCGKTRKLVEVDRNDKQFGEAESGSHPWMALVVLTRQPQGILCYATIVHPRAAITAGDCVYGRTSPKEVILIAGLWSLSDRTRIQNRVVTVQLHPQYRPKVLAHDLALLYWKTPLKLNANIQPACLGSARDTTDCKFFGWGGFDQGIRTRSRWQRASIISAQECASRFSKAVSMPDDGFCATVESRGTVTGIGGPLICNVNGRKTSSGVAIWRDNALVLVPAQEWILRVFQDLDIQ